MLYTGMYFIIALLILIIVHESGHFLVARMCGVKVLKFSFGFGRVIASWRDKQNTEYAWSLLPFGGYVKMLDENEGEVQDFERHLAFNNQSLLVRTAVVIAGPLFNFLLAFVLLWFVAVIGVKSIAPIISDVRAGSISENAGLTPKNEIVSFNGKNIYSWRQFQYAIMPLIGSDSEVLIKVKSTEDNKLQTLHMPLVSWKLNPKSPDILDSLGITPYIPKILPVIGEVMPDSAAYASGLAADDVILTLDDKPVDNWLDLVNFVRNNPDKLITLTVNRAGQIIPININTGHITKKGKVQGFLGLQSKPIHFPKGILRVERSGPISALSVALSETYELTKGTFVLIGRMINGRLSIQNIGGPVGIAKGAGDSARSGFAPYLAFLALLSISLGVLNLLPIPLLDGGHLFYYLIEGLRGRPLSNEFKIKGAYFGMLLLLVLTVVALTNDLTKMVGA
ncbi:MAG: RIP metalloprotease RseP [Legionellaceae bacterium]|nr:RIP metalloprotease RseP [Legionellaceae bacterium]